MSASKINPNVWNGEERSGGYIAKNNAPTSANSPQFKGRIYLIGVGWYWISAWVKPTGQGELLALRAQEMTDEHAAQYCAPKPIRGKPNPRPHHSGQAPFGNGQESAESDIPF